VDRLQTRSFALSAGAASPADARQNHLRYERAARADVATKAPTTAVTAVAKDNARVAAVAAESSPLPSATHSGLPPSLASLPSGSSDVVARSAEVRKYIVSNIASDPRAAAVNAAAAEAAVAGEHVVLQSGWLTKLPDKRRFYVLTSDAYVSAVCFLLCIACGLKLGL